MKSDIVWKIPQSREEIIGWQQYLIDGREGACNELPSGELYCFAYLDDLMAEHENKTGRALSEDDLVEWEPDGLDDPIWGAKIDERDVLFAPESMLRECGMQVAAPAASKPTEGHWTGREQSADRPQPPSQNSRT